MIDFKKLCPYLSEEDIKMKYITPAIEDALLLIFEFFTLFQEYFSVIW